MSVHDKNWKYTPVRDMKPNYLAEKFRKIRAEQKRQAEAKVQQFPKWRKA